LGLGAAGLAFWAALDFQARRLRGPVLSLVLLVTACGSAFVFYKAHTAKLAEFTGVFATALIPFGAWASFRPSRALPASALPVVGVVLPGLGIGAYFYTPESPPWSVMALLAVAPLAPCLLLLPGARKLKPWPQALLGMAAAVLLVSAAGILADKAYPEE